MDLPAAAALPLGLGLLVAGGALLVRSASRMAAAWGVPPLVVGLTVVAMGTSAPELAVSVIATASDRPDVALGNVLGSNIFNVLVVLGLAALITPLAVGQQFVRKEVPLLIGATGATWLLCLGGTFHAASGAAFLMLLVGYVTLAVRRGRLESAAVQRQYAEMLGATTTRWLPQAGQALIALGLLVLGSHYFVEASVDVARALGIGDLAIAVLIVAPGTSLPELVTSVVAAVKGERDIAVGNVIGSNIFNLLGVLGASALVGGGIPVAEGALRVELPLLLGTAVVCLPVFITGSHVARWEGGLFLGCYGAYVGWLLLAAAASDARRTFEVALLGFALPLGLLGVGVSLWQARLRQRGPRHE